MKSLEDKMQRYLLNDAPVQIPEGGKKVIVQWAPWISLVIGVLSLLSALSLWKFANDANEILDYANEFGRAYGIQTSEVNISMFVYISILFIVAQGLLMVLAFRGLRERSKERGWNYLLYSVLASLAYTVFSLFIEDYRGFGSFLFGIIGIVISLYILAQIKSHYKSVKTPTPVKKK